MPVAHAVYARAFVRALKEEENHEFSSETPAFFRRAADLRFFIRISARPGRIHYPEAWLPRHGGFATAAGAERAGL